MTPRALLATLILVAAATGTAAAQDAPRPTERPKPFAAFSASAERLKDSVSARFGSALRAATPLPVLVAPDEELALRDSIAAVARAQLGTKYRLGAESPARGFDCSGLVQFVLSFFDVAVPRTALTQSRVGRAVQRDPAMLRPGDLLTFGTGRRVTHIGIYVGEGRFVHASPTGRKVVESSIAERDTWYRRNWVGVRRVLASADSTS